MTTILIVEDEDLLREGVQEVLEMNDYVVIGAADGVEALQWLSETPVDLVVTDLVMPNMDGVDFVAKLRQLYVQLPVIVVSGSSHSVMARYGLKSIEVPGANASISKPFKSKDLLAKIEELLAERVAPK
jgi:DNA-binding response OmpR family regulator